MLTSIHLNTDLLKIGREVCSTVIIKAPKGADASVHSLPSSIDYSYNAQQLCIHLDFTGARAHLYSLKKGALFSKSTNVTPRNMARSL